MILDHDIPMEVARAQWQVRKVLLLLDTHRLLRTTTPTPEWEAKEAEYRERLARAHAELGRVRQLSQVSS
jgi:hypothetical protein